MSSMEGTPTSDDPGSTPASSTSSEPAFVDPSAICPICSSPMRNHMQPFQGSAEDHGQQLELLNKILLQHVSARDYDSPIFKQFIADDFEAVQANGADVTLSSDTREAFLDNVRRYAEVAPNYKFEIVYTCSDMNREKGRATVWLTSQVTGQYFDDLKRDGVSRCDWIRRKGVWVLVKHLGLTGAGSLLEGS